jgi:Tol biopolymer transport system component
MLATADSPGVFVTVRQGMTPLEASTPVVSLSRDGRYVAFVSYVPLTGSDRLRHPSIYVLDRITGAVTLESAPPDGCDPGRACAAPSISADGRFLVFETLIDQPLAAPPRSIVLLRDRRTGMTRRVGPSRAQPNGSIRQGAVSADGRTVVFASSATSRSR